MAKRLYRRSLESDLQSAYEAEAAGIALISTTKDRLEGVQSFIERRPPDFRGD
jgi:2-(1,2-epoxy-1,2-dihydrophenyl)acetyl-CoA isomerase